jgi:hypothetical protein
MESRPLATRSRWRTASRSWWQYRCLANSCGSRPWKRRAIRAGRCLATAAVHRAVELGAVAGGQDQRLFGGRMLGNAAQRADDDVGPEGQALAGVYRRRLVVQA